LGDKLTNYGDAGCYRVIHEPKPTNSHDCSPRLSLHETASGSSKKAESGEELGQGSKLQNPDGPHSVDFSEHLVGIFSK
jgi:hypothetical protein